MKKYLVLLVAASTLALAGCLDEEKDTSNADPQDPAPSVNRAPEISGSPAGSVQAGTAYAFTPTASDADGDPLTFSASGVPSWASVDTSTGRISGTPADANVGTSGDISISVNDGKATATLAAFRITVTAKTTPPPGNTAPTISGVPPASVLVGQAYSFQPTAADANGDALTFSIAGLPAWATFATSTGRLSGTPGAGHVGTSSSITISVNDGKGGSAALPPFSIQVQAPPPPTNRPPTIGGAPPTTVSVGSAYAFQPSA
ncbi:MAG: putative Ig domain-containing protein, partial [Steroidobacteraceae bacterium]